LYFHCGYTSLFHYFLVLLPLHISSYHGLNLNSSSKLSLPWYFPLEQDVHFGYVHETKHLQTLRGCHSHTNGVRIGVFLDERKFSLGCQLGGLQVTGFLLDALYRNSHTFFSYRGGCECVVLEDVSIERSHVLIIVNSTVFLDRPFLRWKTARDSDVSWYQFIISAKVVWCMMIFLNYLDIWLQGALLSTLFFYGIDLLDALVFQEDIEVDRWRPTEVISKDCRVIWSWLLFLPWC